jgi:hypothetical protein
LKLNRLLVGTMSLIMIAGIFSPAFANPGTGTLFGTDASGGTLLNINTVSGVGNVVGPTNAPGMPALAFDHTTNTMFSGSGGGSGSLFTINTGSGQATPVGVSNLGFAAVGGMDVASDGTIYAAVNIAGDGGTGSDHLATVDKNSGLFTIIGPFGNCVGVPPLPVNGAGSCDNEGMEGIAFDSAGTLWGVHSQRGSAGAPGLYTININTGAANFVSPLLDSNQNPASGGFVSLQFACDGTLFGGTARAIQSNDGGFLATINPNTGIFTLSPNPATGGSSLGGLAFDTQCPIVGGDFLPIDTTTLLLAAAQSPAAWLSSLTIIALGIGAYVFTRNPSNLRNIRAILRDYFDRI